MASKSRDREPRHVESSKSHNRIDQNRRNIETAEPRDIETSTSWRTETSKPRNRKTAGRGGSRNPQTANPEIQNSRQHAKRNHRITKSRNHRSAQFQNPKLSASESSKREKSRGIDAQKSKSQHHRISEYRDLRTPQLIRREV